MENLNDSLQSSSSFDTADTTVKIIHDTITTIANIPVIQPHNADSVTFGFMLLAFASITLISALIAIKKGIGPSYTMRIVGLITVIFAAVFVVISGYSDTQIAPVVGLLGTVVGYVLNRGHNTSSGPEN